jgi:hypothetical protein
MPFVALTLDDGERGRRLAPSLARAIADALSLPPDGVLVSVVGGAAVCDGHGPVAGWPSAIIHGRPRPEPAARAAADAARSLLARTLDLGEDQVWVAWSTG